MARMYSSDESITVLHVDDEAEFAELAATFLEREADQLTVDTAMSATEGLEQLSEGDFDCVVSDHDMPGQSGIEFLKAVRNTHPELPFILFTGKGSEEVASDAISAGVTDYLQKKGGTSQYAVLANRIKNAVERYRSQRAVQAVEQKLTQLAERTDHVLFMFSADWSELIFVNSAYEDIWGQSVADLREDPKRFLTQIVPADRETVARSMEEISNGESDTVEYRVERADGDRRWVRAEAKPIFGEGGTVVRITGIVRDITDRVEYRQQLETMLDNLPGYVYRHWNEPGWPLEFVKGSAEAVTGYTAEELTQEVGLAEKVIHPDDREDVHSRVEHGLEEDGSYELTYRIITKTDEERWVWERGQLIEEPLSGELKLEGFITDVTDQKERERTLRRQTQRLDEFASVVSHDLRNPLNVATGHLELVEEDCDSEHIEPVDQALTRMDALVDDLLTLAREGDPAREPELIDLEDVSNQCWRNVEDDDATIRVRTDRTIKADRNHLRQLLENLYRNAVEHGGTDVTVTVGELDDGFYVEDDGVGIPEHERDNVLETGYSTAETGTGFGLTIAKQMVNAHDWDIGITEGENGGVRVEITDVDSAG
ncbi:PAS domain-containing protein [Halobacteria archaeon AArc-dxtr1]|nr:PAS domain-containing protein [Halobacteria archaeon AArc-dxtr1]